jgi:cyclophilin family peptidyl-prolyl cis-trans isomerase
VLAEGLGAAATPAAVQQLMELLPDQDARVVTAALGALGQAVPAGDSALRAAAVARLTHDDIGVRTAAIELVGRERSVASVAELVAAFRRAESDELSDARLAVVHALAGIAETGPAERARVEAAFLAALPRSPDYLVRRAVAERFGEAAHRRHWAAVLPLETGRSPEEYRDLARRYLLGQLRTPTVTIETERGNLELALYPSEAPLTVDNFLRLVDRRFFDNGRWHRVVPNFVIQDGDPRGDGSGGPGTTIRDEINRRRYDRGAVGMALAGADTGGSQFFITHSPQPHLDGGYTVFGHVVSGWNVLDQIVQGDRIRRIFR